MRIQVNLINILHSWLKTHWLVINNWLINDKKWLCIDDEVVIGLKVHSTMKSMY